MGTISIRFTNPEDVKRWEQLEAKGKLGPVQKRRLEEWRRTNGNPPNNRLGMAILENARRQIKGDKWMRTQVEILTKPEADIVFGVMVEAVVKDGLAIHRSAGVNGVWKYRWTVTHVRSGLAIVSGLPTPSDARDLVNDLLPITDWNQHENTVYQYRAIVRPIVEAYEQKVIHADCSNQYL